MKLILIMLLLVGQSLAQYTNHKDKTAEQLSGITSGSTNIASKSYWTSNAYAQLKVLFDLTGDALIEAQTTTLLKAMPADTALRVALLSESGNEGWFILIDSANAEDDIDYMDSAYPAKQWARSDAIYVNNNITGLVQSYATTTLLSAETGVNVNNAYVTDIGEYILIDSLYSETALPYYKYLDSGIAGKQWKLKEGSGSDLKIHRSSIYTTTYNDVTSTTEYQGLWVLSLLRLSNNKLMLIHTQGEGDLQGGYTRLFYRLSDDNALSWTSPTLILSDTTLFGGVAYQAQDGRISVYCRTSLWNGVTQVTENPYMTHVYTRNEGKTWSVPTLIDSTDDPTGRTIVPYGVITPIANNKLLMPVYVAGSGDDTSYVKISSDDGMTWGSNILVKSNGVLTAKYNEGAYGYAGDSTIIGIIRNDSSATTPFLQVKSVDNGLTWTGQGEVTFGNPKQYAPTMYTVNDGGGTKLILYWRDASGTSVILGDPKLLKLSVAGWDIQTKRVFVDTDIALLKGQQVKALREKGDNFSLIAMSDRTLSDTIPIHIIRVDDPTIASDLIIKGDGFGNLPTLTLGTSLMFTSLTDNILYTLSNAYWDDATNKYRYRIASKYATRFEHNKGDFIWYTGPNSGAADAEISWTQRMLLDNTYPRLDIGNVGTTGSLKGLRAEGQVTAVNTGGTVAFYLTNNGTAPSLLAYDYGGSNYVPITIGHVDTTLFINAKQIGFNTAPNAAYVYDFAGRVHADTLNLPEQDGLNTINGDFWFSADSLLWNDSGTIYFIEGAER